MYKINPSSYQGVFVLPKELVEKHIVLASEKHLKVIIYAYYDPARTLDVSDTAKALGISEADAADALEYWKNLGLLMDADSTTEIIPEKKPVPTEEPKTKAVKKPSKSSPGRLTYNEICKRVGESEEVRTLFAEAQESLGRTIGTADQSSLLMLHDYYGLPIEIILSICEYARIHGKCNNMNYIYSVGVDWSTREIDTIERADEEFKKLERNDGAWNQFCALSGVKQSTVTAKKLNYFYIWINEWHFTMNMILAAYEEMHNHTEKTSFEYMNKVLSSWLDKGIKTIEQVQEEKKKFQHHQESLIAEKTSKKSYKTAKKSESPHKASYDIDKAENRAKTSVPTLKKRGE